MYAGDFTENLYFIGSYTNDIGTLLLFYKFRWFETVTAA
ncbi:hypothetical protein HMPREF9413_5760 [Paenibacillus sp. HGF7]|nr:hypothetical protein HMPREF9413_5760 [Paenibacillus sp. HGF7]